MSCNIFPDSFISYIFFIVNPQDTWLPVCESIFCPKCKKELLVASELMQAVGIWCVYRGRADKVGTNTGVLHLKERFSRQRKVNQSLPSFLFLEKFSQEKEADQSLHLPLPFSFSPFLFVLSVGSWFSVAEENMTCILLFSTLLTLMSASRIPDASWLLVAKKHDFCLWLRKSKLSHFTLF